MATASVAVLIGIGEFLEEYWSIVSTKEDRYRFDRQLFPHGGCMEFGSRMLDWARARTDPDAKARWIHVQNAAPLLSFNKFGTAEQAVDFFLDGRPDKKLREAANRLVREMDPNIGNYGLRERAKRVPWHLKRNAGSGTTSPPTTVR